MKYLFYGGTYMRMNKSKGQLLILFLAVGFFVGIIYENVIAKRSVVFSDLFLRSNLELYLQTNIISEKYLWYVAKARIILLAAICIFSYFRWKKLFVILCLTVCGFFAGVMSVAAVMQLGIKGILLCITGVLPQGIFYVMAYSMLFVYWFRYPESRWNRAKLLFVIIMFLAGIALETYVNPALMKLVIKFL